MSAWDVVPFVAVAGVLILLVGLAADAWRELSGEGEDQ